LHPILFEIFGHQIRTYSVAMAMAFVAAILLLRRRSPYEQIDVNDMLNCAILTIFGTILGGRAMFVINTWGDRFATEGRSNWEVFLEVFKIWEGGLVFYGGFFGSILIVWLYLRSRKIDALPMIDMFAAYGGLGLAIHRPFGCYLNGCCYGGPTHVPWGVHFPPGSSATGWYGVAQAVHPTQIYMGLSGLFLYFLLIWFRRRKQAHGEVFGLFLMVYAVYRFLIEIVRGDKIRGHVEAFALVYLVLFVAGLGVYLYLRGRDQGLQKFKWVGIAMFLTGGLFGLFGTGSGSTLDGALSSPFSTSQYIGFFVFTSGAALMIWARHFGRRVQPEYGTLVESDPEIT
jgi:phosphatidylglycerol---prolipoprotein diacylglyceryl transferase